MSQLHFKKVFWPLIRSGAKTTTIRRWSAPRVKPNARCYSPGLGWLLIETVEPISLDQLTAADARADGFATLALLHKTLRELYPDHQTDGRAWFRVTFRRQDPHSQPDLPFASTTAPTPKAPPPVRSS